MEEGSAHDDGMLEETLDYIAVIENQLANDKSYQEVIRSVYERLEEARITPMPWIATMLAAHINYGFGNAIGESILDGGGGGSVCGLVGAWRWVQYPEPDVRFCHGANLAMQPQLARSTGDYDDVFTIATPVD